MIAEKWGMSRTAVDEFSLAPTSVPRRRRMQVCSTLRSCP